MLCGYLISIARIASCGLAAGLVGGLCLVLGAGPATVGS